MINQDLWVNFALNRIHESIRTGNADLVVFSDVRRQNEADAIHAHGGLVVQIERPELTGAVDTHVSESGIPPESIDLRVVNNGNMRTYYAELGAVLDALNA
jgi:hypothetical protein